MLLDVGDLLFVADSFIGDDMVMLSVFMPLNCGKDGFFLILCFRK